MGTSINACSAPPGVATPDNARQLVAAALVAFADQHEARLDVSDESVVRDVALARSMAAHMTGWTHTTRLRDFLASQTARDEVDAHVEAVTTGV